jgi:hypothetical protein
MNKKALVVATIVIICVLAVSIGSDYYLANQTHPSIEKPPTPIVSMTPQVSATPQISPTPTPTSTQQTSQTPTPNAEPIQSLSNYYLQYGGNESKIFVVSANASYGAYPGPTVTSPPYVNDTFGTAEHGEPCVIINVTLRNDYSSDYLPPNGDTYQSNSTMVYLGLTAYLFSGTNQVDATDITNALPIASYGTNEATAALNSGESTTLSIFLRTDSANITSFQLLTTWIGTFFPP